MKKVFWLAIGAFFCLAALSACGRQDRDIAISIGKLKISKQELDASLSRWQNTKNLTPAEKQKLINAFINRKLILLAAEKEGLDKDPRFLQNVQFFWEQALLKLAIGKKINALAQKIRVSEKEIKNYYQSHKQEFGQKPLAEVYAQIKFLILRQKQQKALSEWISTLHQKTKVKINYKLLGLKKGGKNG